MCFPRSYTFQQLDQCNVGSVRNKARFLVDKIGEQALPPLKASGTKDELVAWILDVQIKTIAIGAKIVGVTPRHLGAPADWQAAPGARIARSLLLRFPVPQQSPRPRKIVEPL